MKTVYSELVLTIICSIFASTGFWAFITMIVQNRKNKVSLEAKLLRGLAHDRICTLGEKYIAQGYISKDDYRNLYEYLNKPYEELGGNGAAKRIMQEVKKLPLKEDE